MTEKTTFLKREISQWLKREIGWGEVILIILFVGLGAWFYLQRQNLLSNSAYTKGVITGIVKGSKGSRYIGYVFNIDGKTIKSSWPIKFCNGCSSCCNCGDTVIVRYEVGNPENNDLVHNVP